MILCTNCGKQNKRAKSGLCGTCYARKWYRAISEEKRKEIIKKAYEYNKAHAKQRSQTAKRYRLKKGIKWGDEFKALFKASKRLERAVAKANQYSVAGESD